MGDGNGRLRNAIIALVGCLAFALLHLLFVLAWQRFFTASAWPGYEETTQSGLVEPWFVNTPRSLWLTRITFFVLAFITARTVRDRPGTAALALWVGAAAAVAATWFTTKSHSAEWGWLGSMLYPFRVLLPIALGASGAMLLRRMSRGRAAT
jgi:hypothetical protein